MTWTVILTFLCCFLFLLTIFLGVKLYHFSIVLIDIEDAIEESLDILDERYNKINEILQRPVFFDSLEVRQVISEIKETHNAVLIIANKLTRNTREIENVEKTKEEANQ